MGFIYKRCGDTHDLERMCAYTVIVYLHTESEIAPMGKVIVPLSDTQTTSEGHKVIQQMSS